LVIYSFYFLVVYSCWHDYLICICLLTSLYSVTRQGLPLLYS
jgi:hypothetical protein